MSSTVPGSSTGTSIASAETAGSQAWRRARRRRTGARASSGAPKMAGWPWRPSWTGRTSGALRPMPGAQQRGHGVGPEPRQIDQRHQHRVTSAQRIEPQQQRRELPSVRIGIDHKRDPRQHGRERARSSARVTTTMGDTPAAVSVSQITRTNGRPDSPVGSRALGRPMRLDAPAASTTPGSAALTGSPPPGATARHRRARRTRCPAGRRGTG